MITRFIFFSLGGSGLIGRTLASEYPEMNITVFDLPPVVQLAKKLYPENNTGQVTFVSGVYTAILSRYAFTLLKACFRLCCYTLQVSTRCYKVNLCYFSFKRPTLIQVLAAIRNSQKGRNDYYEFLLGMVLALLDLQNDQYLPVIFGIETDRYLLPWVMCKA